MIKEPLNREAAEQIFEKEAICLGYRDAIPQYRIVEIFGETAGYFMELNMGHKKHLNWGTDYISIGGGNEDSPIIYYLYKEGFMKVVAQHNYSYSVEAHEKSEAGKFVDELWRQRSERIDREDAEAAAREEAEKQKRKAKREAAKAAKAAMKAAEKENSGGEKHNAEVKG